MHRRSECTFAAGKSAVYRISRQALIWQLNKLLSELVNFRYMSRCLLLQLLLDSFRSRSRVPFLLPLAVFFLFSSDTTSIVSPSSSPMYVHNRVRSCFYANRSALRKSLSDVACTAKTLFGGSSGRRLPTPPPTLCAPLPHKSANRTERCSRWVELSLSLQELVQSINVCAYMRKQLLDQRLRKACAGPTQRHRTTKLGPCAIGGGYTMDSEDT